MLKIKFAPPHTVTCTLISSMFQQGIIRQLVDREGGDEM
jgi:hypothetical protein